MEPVEHIFLDFDGVINDDERMNCESRRLIAERMACKHGGGLEKWLGALQEAFTAANDWARKSHWEPDISRWLGEYDRVWLEQLFRAAGLEPPAQGRAELGWRLREEAYANIDCLYPDVPAALPLLKGGGSSARTHRQSAGRALYVASGGREARLEVMLRKAGLRDYFQELFGCDTVNIVKESAEYYRRIFDRLGLAPTQCLVVDDNPDCIRWAKEAGAKAVLLDRKGLHTGAEAGLIVSDLLELARMLGGSLS